MTCRRADELHDKSLRGVELNDSDHAHVASCLECHAAVVSAGQLDGRLRKAAAPMARAEQWCSPLW
jgi:hypothetical protein